MVRKRPASELDLQPDSSSYPRLTRRTTANTSVSATFIGGGELDGHPPLSFVGSNPNPNPSSPIIIPISPLPPPPSPSVCGFSGLPLFLSEIDQAAPVTTAERVVGPSSDEAGGGGDSAAATAWIDGIIGDLIGSAAAEVSISQIIHNVREIIQPCNPSLASILEFRLRSLTSDPSPQEPSDKRRREIVPPTPKRVVDPSFPSSSTHLPSWEVPNSSNPNPTLPQQQKQNPPHQQQQRRSASGSSEEAAAATAALAAAKARKEEIRKQKRDEEGLQLLTLLLQCAEAVASDNLEDADRMLLQISELSTPFGTSAQRVAAYFSEAMSARLVSSCLGIYAPLPSIPHRYRLASAFQVFNGISPFVKFSHFTANQAIQEAFEHENNVHIIDLDIMQGLQWPGLFHILASRPGGPPRVRLTGLGSSMDALEATGKRLSDFAETLGLPFEFYPVAEKVGNLDPERLGVRRREAVAVHWLHHSLYDVTGSDTNTLSLLQR